jgi:DNA-binding MarR family transcriptional regulator
MAGSKGQSETLDNESEITLGLLNAVHDNSSITQRSVASDLGIALGLTNAYLKRCIRKGFIKVQQIPSNRYAYYLTPQGFAEKTRLTADYLAYSFTFFRRARQQCTESLDECERKGWHRIALAGASDLAEITTLCAGETSVQIIGIIDTGPNHSYFAGLPVVENHQNLEQFDAIILTNVSNPQDCFDHLTAVWPGDRIITPKLLGVSEKNHVLSREPS